MVIVIGVTVLGFLWYAVKSPLACREVSLFSCLAILLGSFSNENQVMSADFMVERCLKCQKNH